MRECGKSGVWVKRVGVQDTVARRQQHARVWGPQGGGRERIRESGEGGSVDKDGGCMSSHAVSSMRELAAGSWGHSGEVVGKQGVLGSCHAWGSYTCARWAHQTLIPHNPTNTTLPLQPPFEHLECASALPHPS